VILLRVPGVVTYRSLVLRVVTAACKMAVGEGTSLSEEFEVEAISAIGEAFNNISLHGYDGVPPGNVEIDIRWSDEEMVVVLTDQGKCFDPKGVTPPVLDDLPEGGMGLFIMRSFMDVIEYQPGPPNILRLVKRIRRRACVA
jgi:serine/threonine-protein kinase RsbW